MIWRLTVKMKEVFLAWLFTLSLSALHTAAILLSFFSLSRDSGQWCGSGLVVSEYDLFVGERFFRYNEISWNTILYLLDEPALHVSNLLSDKICPVSVTFYTPPVCSWVLAALIFSATTLQWLSVGIIIDRWRQSQNFRWFHEYADRSVPSLDR